VSAPASPQPVKLIASVLTAEEDLVPAIGRELEKRFGEVDFCTEALSFHYTEYYNAELGTPLIRHMLSFATLIAPDVLPDIKHATNDIEQQYLKDNRSRRVNIDPGYIALHHMILATCKPFSHRPYLAKGIYADMTLLYKGKTFCPLDWTFPDYRSAELIDILNTVRSVYYRQIHKDCS